MRLERRRVLLTGARSGIGRELALGLAERGAALALVGRRRDPLEATARAVVDRGGRAVVLPADLAEPGEAPLVVDGAADALDGIDILINNAGAVLAGHLEDASVEDVLAMIAVNLAAPILLTRAALPTLRAAGGVDGAAVVGVTSGAARVGMPFYAAYAATKAGLARFNEALRRELTDTGIRVVTAYPSGTDTPMMASSQAGDDLGFGRRPAAEVAAEILFGLESDLSEIDTSPPDRREMQQLNQRDPLAVDAALRSRLIDLEAAVRHHRAM